MIETFVCKQSITKSTSAKSRQLGISRLIINASALIIILKERSLLVVLRVRVSFSSRSTAPEH